MKGRLFPLSSHAHEGASGLVVEFGVLEAREPPLVDLLDPLPNRGLPGYELQYDVLGQGVRGRAG